MYRLRRRYIIKELARNNSTEIIVFHRQGTKAQTTRAKPPHDLIAFTTPAILLADAKRQSLLANITEACALESSRFNSLSLSLFNNFINHCQRLPETANSYYALPGGFLDHALNRTEAALQLFRQQLMQQDTTEEQKLWLYALLSAGILQGIGKLKLDYRVDIYDANGRALTEWNPLLDPLTAVGSYYHYEFQKEGADNLRRRLNALIAFQLMPTAGFAWIASHPDVLDSWLAMLHEDPNGAGVLGAILERAEAIAIQRDILEMLAKNALGGGARVTRVSTFIDRTPESTHEQDKLLGAQFIKWLSEALEKGTISINKAPLLMIPAGLVMSSETFQLFMRDHPEYKNWQMVQKGLMAWGLHRHYTGEPMILNKYAAILPNNLSVHNQKTGKTSSISALELVQRQQSGEQRPLDRLTTSGKWESPKENLVSPQLGFIRGA